ncbi:MAG: Diadenylate cyclase spyDAC; Bacterial checkpoint controller DisA with nucleotide-binding domain [uncultured Thermomicrobiales bacterium]|uniref:Diadenylate cyclase n=1 Tax=uncultured Thermomicrobiales bacterium TaxID=1645740 RepID=A0A6J4V0W5_9BACT|nr:MAG: Diadenylate cyclase spyDAC; Bacterial checkpoint controller DisA with nucleotide-binding domain [uncultured Thermomicrobiales bacterium]
MPDLGYLLSQLGNPRSIFDLLVVTLIVYWLLWVARGTRATQLIRGIAILLALAFFLGTSLQLTTLNWVLSQIWPALVVAVPVIFAPELRRALEQLGQTGAWLHFSPSSEAIQERTVDELVRAAAQLARHRYGALIVLERETGLQNFVERGVPIDAHLTRQLLINIFYPNSPLHDGAVVIRDGRVSAASVVLPLTDNISATGQLGTRHRAAIGVTEVSDALAVVVSEETGQIAVAHNGRLIRNLDQDRLRRVLRSLLRLDRPERERPGWLGGLEGRLPLGGRIGANGRSAAVANGRLPGTAQAPAARREIEPTKTT